MKRGERRTQRSGMSGSAPMSLADNIHKGHKENKEMSAYRVLWYFAPFTKRRCTRAPLRYLYGTVLGKNAKN